MHIRTILHGQFRSPVLHKLRERDRAACSKTPGVNASMRARVHSKGRYSYSQSREPGEARTRYLDHSRRIARTIVSVPHVRQTCLTIDTNGLQRRVLNLILRGRQTHFCRRGERSRGDFAWMRKRTARCVFPASNASKR